MLFSDPTSQSVRDPDDQTTGVLFDEDRATVLVGRHTRRAGRHVRPARGRWLRVVVAMVAVPATAVTIAIQALPTTRPDSGSSSSAVADRPTPAPAPTPAHPENAVRATQPGATPVRPGSAAPAPGAPRAATLGPPSMSSSSDAEPCDGHGCVSWSVAPPDGSPTTAGDPSASSSTFASPCRPSASADPSADPSGGTP